MTRPKVPLIRPASNAAGQACPRRRPTSMPHLDAPPEQLPHPGPQRETHRQRFIEDAERSQQQEQDGRCRAASIDSSWPMMEARTFRRVPVVAHLMVEEVGVQVGEPEDQQRGDGGRQDDVRGFAPGSVGRDHRRGDDRALDRNAGVGGNDQQPAPRRARRRGPRSHAATVPTQIGLCHVWQRHEVAAELRQAPRVARRRSPAAIMIRLG